MRTVAHNVKTFRREFRLIPSFVWGSRIFILFASSMLLVVLSIALFFYHHVYLRLPTYANLSYWTLFWEMPMLLGLAQILVEVDRRRFARNHPGKRISGIRQAMAATDRAKRRMISEHFAGRQDFAELAKELIEQWEWRQALEQRAGSPATLRTRHFFSLPSGGNFATYLGGLLAVIAAVVVALIDNETFYPALPTLWSDFSSAYSVLFQIIVVPIATCVLPAACILDMVIGLGHRAVERANDDYLSDSGFYRYIKELVLLEENKQRRGLMTTTGWAYWSFRIGTAPLRDVPRLWRNKRRSVRLAKRRRSKGC